MFYKYTQMKTLYNILQTLCVQQEPKLLEGLLDSDFDVQDSDVFTLKQMGYKCTNMSANDSWGRGMSDQKCMDLTGIEISQTNRNGINPYKGFEEYVNTVVYHNKVSAGRDGMGFGKWRFAWMIRFVLDYCNDNPDDIKKFIEDCMADKIIHGLAVSIRKMRNKIIIKGEFVGTWGPAKMSMTLTKA